VGAADPLGSWLAVDVGDAEAGSLAVVGAEDVPEVHPASAAKTTNPDANSPGKRMAGD
jgi:hypothetical protein